MQMSKIEELIRLPDLRMIPDDMLRKITEAAIAAYPRDKKSLREYIAGRSGDKMIIPFAAKFNELDAEGVLDKLLYYLYKDCRPGTDTKLREIIVESLMYRLNATKDDIEVQVRLRPKPIITEENEDEWMEELVEMARACPMCPKGIMNPTYDSHYDVNGNICWVLACDKCRTTLSYVETPQGELYMPIIDELVEVHRQAKANLEEV